MTDKKKDDTVVLVEEDAVDPGWFENQLEEATPEQIKELEMIFGVEDIELTPSTAQKMVEDSEYKPEINERFIQYESPERIEEYIEKIQKEEAEKQKDIYQQAVAPHKVRLLDQLNFEIKYAKMEVEEYQKRGISTPRWLLKKIDKIEEQLDTL